ncbi:DUF6263 family protein [Clostridium sp. ZS2-4]|uniref:DUF6263 family protein n=1 Tax=Clostridium sp. ZS2-4 TaxID=2987703 RepID=UPI00227A3B83|nr:DUF6263 family protein [Clostridium sp. ZS2-4]MCY6355232.1 DUF6263 family protein [Clostridium sp. ZS2-4]
MKKKRVSFIIFVLISMILFNGCIQKKVKLSLKLKKGDSFKIDMLFEQKVTQEIKDRKTEVDSRCNIGYSCFVTDVDENKNATVQVSFDSLNIKSMANNGQTLEYNSGDPTADMSDLSKVYSTLIGEEFTVKISEDGKIKEVMGIDKIIEKVLKELNIKNSKQQEEIQKMIVEQFGDEALTKQVQNITSVYPDEPVKSGDTWEKKTDVSSEYPLQAESKYTLVESKDKMSEITVDSKVKTKDNAEPLILGNIKISYDIEGTQKGTLNVDEESGITKHVEMTHKYSGKIKFTSEDPNIGAQTFPMTAEGRTVISISGK